MTNKNHSKTYLEWLFPIADYIECMRPGERKFEKGIPAFCAILSAIVCRMHQISNPASCHLNNLLPNVLSILIGFTISAIAIIIATGNESSQMINKEMDRSIGNKKISFKQWFLVNLIYYTICESFFLLLTFIIPLFQKIFSFFWITDISVFFYVYAIMRVLFGIIKVVTKLYQVFYKECQNKKS